MIYEDLPRGRAKIASYIPTLPALRYLYCCTVAGWHSCNELYRQEYPRGAGSYLLIYTVKGAGRLEAFEKMHPLLENSIAIIPAKTPMKYYTDSDVKVWEFYWLNLSGERVLAILDNLIADKKEVIRAMPPLEGIFSELVKEALSETERSEMLNTLLEKMISKAVFNRSRKKSTADDLLEYLSTNYRSHINLESISERFYLSKNQIIRIIRRQTGYSPHEYLTRIRLTKACELLEYTRTPISEIGRCVGYENKSHFSAAFRKLYGITPAEYRIRFSN